MRVFDLSLRHKIPLWGSALIVASILAVSVALMFRAYDDLRADLFTSSESLGRTLAKTLFPALLHDDLWRAFEIVQAPFQAGTQPNPLAADIIFVANEAREIVVASDPKRLPTLARLDELAGDFRRLGMAMREKPVVITRDFDLPDSANYYVAVPLAEAERQIGTLFIGHSREAFRARFLDLILRGLTIGALVVAVLLPINWYWGRRTAEPLVELADGMAALVQGRPAPVPAADRYAWHDELGRLFTAYREAAQALNEKAMLEREMLHSERLAAVGRLAAGIAHEVNNPLGGMLMAIDNLKQRGPLDPATAKTVSLLERGLQQVAEIVGALLVEARVTRRELSRHDFDDLHTLIEPQAAKKQVALDWNVNLPETLALPAGVVRQVVINLLLNALQAAPEGGWARLSATLRGNVLEIEVANSGGPLPAEVRSHLFEPFVSGREGGHGLGLWVTYQTVVQSGGRIEARDENGEVSFLVTLPLEQTSA